MDKVSIGLRGWRFDEDAVLTDDGALKPVTEMEPDVRERVLRLQRLVESPCDACWLIHGDEEIDRCRLARVVYGEPFEEVVLCEEHEADFLYWFHERGGADLAGTERFEDGFHEWFLDGGRAPDGYEGVDHVEVAPEEVPDPETAAGESEDEASAAAGDDATDEDGEEATPADDGEGDAPAPDAGAPDDPPDDDTDDLGLGMDYPTKD